VEVTVTLPKGWSMLSKTLNKIVKKMSIIVETLKIKWKDWYKN